jgi:hypothetical protein
MYMEYLQTCGLSQQSMSNADIAYNKEIQITKRKKKKNFEIYFNLENDLDSLQHSAICWPPTYLAFRIICCINQAQL